MATPPSPPVPVEGARAPKNIVICCDGTGNEVTGNLSNVLKLFRILEKDELQRVYYHPGVGTVATENAWERFRARLSSYWGLATGAGLDDNILDAYRFLVETYEEGDCVFLFGFSRGAYTVRALAGFIHLVGLLQPDQIGIADYALTTYKRAGWHDEKAAEKAARGSRAAPAGNAAAGRAVPGGQAETSGFRAGGQFKRVMECRSVPIHFIGVWDTVASMIVPGSLPFSFRLRTLPFTRRNPSVRAFRHAMAIDERRRMFRLNRWEEGQKFEEDHWNPPEDGFPDQDCEQVWFAGVHSDIGGGYAETESGLSKWPLMWMIDEAASDKHGLRIRKPMYRYLACGKPLPGGRLSYVGPNALGPMHRSLHGFFWWLIEIIPKSAHWREWRSAWLGFYLPLGEPRPVPPGEVLHPSVTERRSVKGPAPGEAVVKGLDYPPYDPVNLRDRRPMPPPPGPAMARLSAITAPLAQFAFLGLLVWGIVRLAILLWSAGAALVERLFG
ncbi:MAG TPA: DUF2235 domain-containing protein [Allosphingosinicella sp.]|jgi:uncharacterized protein (DUF2235 family)